MTTLNRITGIVVGQYGTDITLQIVDDEGQAVDISTYTGISIKALSPDAQTTLTFAGSFVSSGADGRIKFTPTNGNAFTRDGIWQGQVELTKTNVVALTVPFELDVEKRI